MAATNVTVNLSDTYTPPGAPANSGTATYQVIATCAAQNVGQIDINPSDAPATVIGIPFGSVGSLKVLILKNLGTVDVGVRLNAAVADNFRLPPGGELVWAAPVAAGGTQITAVNISVITSPMSAEFIQYQCHGD